MISLPGKRSATGHKRFHAGHECVSSVDSVVPKFTSVLLVGIGWGIRYFCRRGLCLGSVTADLKKKTTSAYIPNTFFSHLFPLCTFDITTID